MRRFVIVGDGAAGTAALELLRQEDSNAAITLLSADPNPCYFRAALTNYLIGELRDGEIWAIPPDFYDRHRIERLFCTAERLDAQAKVVVTDDGRRIPFDALLIASGARAREGDIPGNKLAGVRTFRSLQDVNGILNDLPSVKQAVINGGGILGLEWVHGLHLRGVHVAFAMRGDIFWPVVLDRTASDIVLSRMRRDGVDLQLGEEVTEALSRDGRRVAAVRFKSGKTLDCQLYGTAFGIVPNSEWLEGSGLEIARGFIKVDAHMGTNLPGVFAAGDITSYQDRSLPFPNPGQLWMPARQQAQVAARNMLGARDTFRPGALYNATRLWDLDMGSLGISVPKGDEGFQELSHFPEPLIYKKVVLNQQGQIVGALLLGDRREGRAIKRLMDLQLDVRPIQERLFDDRFDLKGWIRQSEGRGVEQRQYAATMIVGSEAASGMTQMVARARVQEGPKPQAVAAELPGTGQVGSARAALLVDGKEVALKEGETRIGRAPDNDVVLALPSVSAHHAAISKQGDSYFVSDLRSTNGTFLNNQRLSEPHPLGEGDELRMGDVQARFRGTAAVQQLEKLEPVPGATSGWLLSPEWSYELNAPLIRIGRATENEIALPSNPQASRLHAQVTRQSADGSLYLLDMGSANGTLVNGARMTTPRRLQEGDVVQIGGTSFRFAQQRPADAAPPYGTRRAQAGSPFLAVVEGPNQGQREPLQGALRIGRSEECDLILADARVSRFHAELLWQEGRALVRDLGSANGTWLGTTRLWNQQAVPLPDEGELRLGATLLRLEFGGQATRPKEQRIVGGETIIVDRPAPTIVAKPLWLTFRDAGGQPPVPLGDEPMTLGRGEESDVMLTDGAASRHHIRIERRADGVFVSDMGSANGTFLNDIRIGTTFTPMRAGDVLRVGQSTIRLTDVPPTYTPAAPARPAGVVGPHYQLRVGGEGLQLIPLGTEPVVLGRAASCTLVLADAQASSRHAQVELQGRGVQLRDLGSTNGTFLNEQRVGAEGKAMQPGDVLRIGNTFIALEVASAEAAPPAARPAPAAKPVATPPPLPPAAPVPWQIHVVEGSGSVPYTLAGEALRLGRAAGNDVVLADPQVSSRHLQIELRDGQPWLTDLESSNGTFLNEQRLPPNQPHPLTPQDRVRVGSTTLRVVAGAAATPPITPPAAPPAPVRVVLRFAESSGLPPRELGATPLSLGRAAGNDVVLADPQVSSRHLQIELRDGQPWLTDLESSNGTFLNEQRLPPNQPHPLTPQDRVRVGTTELKVDHG